MKREYFRQTLLRTLKWYPLVIAAMGLMAVVLTKWSQDPRVGIGLAVMGGIVGPALEAVFYYREQVKKGPARARATVFRPASSAESRLRQAAGLFRDGLISEDEYQHIRHTVVRELAGETEAGQAPGESHRPDELAGDLPGIPTSSPDAGMKIHPWLAVVVAASWPAMGFFLCLVIETLADDHLPGLVRSGINLLVGGLGVFYLFPSVYRAPFGPLPLQEYRQRLGLYLPPRPGRHALLGTALAGCTLGGMLAASLLTGRYTLDWSTISVDHIIFSLNPGILEEIFYRGILVMLLLPRVKSLPKALAWQIVIFGLAHIKGIGWTACIEVVSVMLLAVAFTYTAYKTQTLLAGIVFHFLHDALLFLVQPPGGVYVGLPENLLFYALLWLMVGVACLVVRYAADHLQVSAGSALYPGPDGSVSTAQLP